MDGQTTSIETEDGRWRLSTPADSAAIEAVPIRERYNFWTVPEALAETVRKYPKNKALSFQLQGKADAPLTTLTYEQMSDQIIQFANGLAKAGVKPGDTVALLLPNLPETMIAHFAAMGIGIVAPINPLLDASVIAGILRESDATTLITLAPFLKTDVAQKAAEALADAPNVRLLVEIDMLPHVPWPAKAIASLLRPKVKGAHKAKTLAFRKVLSGGKRGQFAFDREITPETIGAYFHTGGTTGVPKLAMHAHGSMITNALTTHKTIMTSDDVIISALPLFHVFSAYVMALSPFVAGAHVVLVTPQGFRGEGVIPNFWKLIERHKATFLCSVPTAIAALDQVPVNADTSSLRYMSTGSAPLPQALFRRFEEKTGVRILEGYGMTEATCVTSANPPDGERKIGSVGLIAPYTKVRICHFDENRAWTRDCAAEEVGEICLNGPNIFAGYKDPAKTKEVFFEHPEAGGRWLKTGDLGRMDVDDYIWVTGRAKDVIIRGGHNIDPGLIEEALAQHPQVAFVGAIGQPDVYAGELPCAYVELIEGATVTTEELSAFASETVSEHAARPVSITVMQELPKTAVGKIFKPDLRKEAIARVFGAALDEAGVKATISVADDKKLGLVAVVKPKDAADREKIGAALDGFARPWRLADA